MKNLFKVFVCIIIIILALGCDMLSPDEYCGEIVGKYHQLDGTYTVTLRLNKEELEYIIIAVSKAVYTNSMTFGIGDVACFPKSDEYRPKKIIL